MNESIEFTGKLLLVGLFLWSGLLHKPTNFHAVGQELRRKSFPLAPFCAASAIVLEIGGSAIVLLPSHTFAPWIYATALIALAGYTMLTAVLFHDFWVLAGIDRVHQLASFLKNVGLTGAFLLLLARA